jgi:uncharacterized protein (TIGR02996 family)
MAKKKAAVPERQPRPEVLAFLDAIKDEPEDDTPRLVLADWLEEHGDEADAARGRFLRLGCEWRKLSQYDPRLATIIDEMKRLRAPHERAWLGPLADLAEVSAYNVRVYLCNDGLVRLHGRPLGLCARYCPPVVQTEAYAWVDEISVESGGLGPMTKFFASPLLDRLHGLRIKAGYAPLREAGAKALAEIDRLASLTHLSLSGNFIGPAGLIALARAPALKNLRHLDLSHNQLQRGGVAVLAKSPLRRLRSLDLSRQNRFEDGLGRLGEAEWLAGLRSLSAAQTWTTDAGLTALLASPGVGNLEKLDLGMNKLTDAAVEAIASCPHLGQLSELSLGGDWSTPGNAVGRRGVEALASSPLLGRLRLLDLGFCRGEGAGEAARILAGSPHWGRLRALSLSAMPIGSAGAVRLAEASSAGRIDHLDLYRCEVGDEGASALADAMRRGTIDKVDLRANNNSEAAYSALQAEFGERIQVNR